MKTTIYLFLLFPFSSVAQLQWQNVDSLFSPLPSSVHVFKTTSLIEGKPNIAYYVEADLTDKNLDFTVDTTYQRRLTPGQFYNKGYDNPLIHAPGYKKPLVVVNASFFSFATNQNLNAIIMNGRVVGYNIHTINGRGKDTFTYRHAFGSAIGISKKRKADIAWLYTDSAKKNAYASQFVITPFKDSSASHDFSFLRKKTTIVRPRTTNTLKKWKMYTAIGGGPVLVQRGEMQITNEEEIRFAGKAIDDKHPRTAMGYTKNKKLIILVIEGRHPNIAEGATLKQEARIFLDLGCTEALNLDGGGSTCMLINGQPTVSVTDTAGQRPVPAVFLIRHK